MDYLVLKYIHIICSTILFGTGIGSAFSMFMANRQKHIIPMYYTVKNVVFADWLFTTPAVIIQFITGLMLVQNAGYSLDEPWVIWAIILYILVGIFWLPVVWIQIKMRDILYDVVHNHRELPQIYWNYDKWWIILGSLAFPTVMGIFYLMIFKPIF